MRQIIDLFNFVIKYIKAIITAYIINPIKRYLSFHIKHVYIPDNKRNRQLLDYLIRVGEDETVQPETPNEIFFENMIKREWSDVFPEENWEDERQQIFTEMAEEMFQYTWINEEEYFKDND